jgi:hypothetical protein
MDGRIASDVSLIGWAIGNMKQNGSGDLAEAKKERNQHGLCARARK